MCFLGAAACIPRAGAFPALCVEPQKPAVIYGGRDALFNYQTGLAVNKQGSLMYIADTNDNMVRQMYCSLGEFAGGAELIKPEFPI